MWPATFSAWLVAALDVHHTGPYAATVTLAIVLWLFSVVVLPALVVGYVSARREMRAAQRRERAA